MTRDDWCEPLHARVSTLIAAALPAQDFDVAPEGTVKRHIDPFELRLLIVAAIAVLLVVGFGIA